MDNGFDSKWKCVIIEQRKLPIRGNNLGLKVVWLNYNLVSKAF